MDENKESGYGKSKVNNLPLTFGKVFVVVAAASANWQAISAIFTPDTQGVARTYTSYTLALAQCVAGRGDIILTAPDFTTAPTAAELLSAETKGVSFISMAAVPSSGAFRASRATAALPQTTQSPLFTVTGRVRILSVIGEVTTAVQNQANATKLVANPTVGADVDICAATSIANAAVGTQLSITGTFATGLVVTPSGAFVSQAAPTVVMPGTLDLNCAASNTGSVKWTVLYEAIDPGAAVIAA